jgi:uncharacterized protein YlzI (FlbEa/FlbD family)
MFIMLTKIEGPEIAVKASAIVALEMGLEETWVTLSTGEKFLVNEFAADIAKAMQTVIVAVR